MDQVEKIFNDIKAKKCNKLLLKVKAGAKHNAIIGVIEIDNKQYLKLTIKAVPEGGKANKMIIDFLAKKMCIPKSALEIKLGKTSSYKVLSCT